MNRFVVALVTAVALGFAPVLAPLVQAQTAPPAPKFQVPITGTLAQGGTFEGTFTPLKFVNNNGTVVALGTISGIAKDAAGNVLASGLQVVALPFSTSPVTPTAAGTAAPGIGAATCPILNLVLGPLHLDLLGLEGRIRFSHAGAQLPEAEELIGRLERAMTSSLARVVKSERRSSLVLLSTRIRNGV